jgi:NADH-quinone oxidoreductase subunit J
MIQATALLFYLFSAVLLGSAVMVVSSRNTVHAVLFLILSFLNAAGLFVLAQAEFLAMILVIVYVGAVAVLFLFVVMMINVELGEIWERARHYSFIGGVVGGILAIELALMMLNWQSSSEAFDLTSAPYSIYKDMTNTEALGNLLYTHYALIFQGAGIILLVAMIGAIVLTLRHREGVRKQKIKDQIAREANNSVRLVDIPSGTGI